MKISSVENGDLGVLVILSTFVPSIRYKFKIEQRQIDSIILCYL